MCARIGLRGNGREKRLQTFAGLCLCAQFLLPRLDQRQVVLDAHRDGLVEGQGLDPVGRFYDGYAAVIGALRGTLIGRLR